MEDLTLCRLHALVSTSVFKEHKEATDAIFREISNGPGEGGIPEITADDDSVTEVLSRPFENRAERMETIESIKRLSQKSFLEADVFVVEEPNQYTSSSRSTSRNQTPLDQVAAEHDEDHLLCISNVGTPSPPLRWVNNQYPAPSDVVDNTVIFADRDRIQAVNLEDEQVRWRVPNSPEESFGSQHYEILRASQRPASSGDPGLLLVAYSPGLFDDEKTLCVIDAASGNVRWEQEGLDPEIISGDFDQQSGAVQIAFEDGSVAEYSKGTDGETIAVLEEKPDEIRSANGSTILTLDDGSQIVGLDGESGEEQWRRTATQTPVTDGERVYITESEQITAVDCTTGETVWTIPNDSKLEPTSADLDKEISGRGSKYYAGSDEADNASTSGWADQFESTPNFVPGVKPIATDETLFVPVENGACAFNSQTSELRWASRDCGEGKPTAIALTEDRLLIAGLGEGIDALDREDGSQKFTFETPLPVETVAGDPSREFFCFYAGTNTYAVGDGPVMSEK